MKLDEQISPHLCSGERIKNIMQKILLFLSSVILSIALLGCPSAAKYPLGDIGTVPIDRNLIGIWETSDDYDVQKVEFIENDPYSYFIKILTYNHKYRSKQISLCATSRIQW
jgi:hypothetical protein